MATGNPLLSYLGNIGGNIMDVGKSIIGMPTAQSTQSDLVAGAPRVGLLGTIKTAMPAVRGIVNVGSDIGDAIEDVYGKHVDHNMKDFQLGKRIMPALGKGYGLIHENILGPLFGYSGANEVPSAKKPYVDAGNDVMARDANPLTPDQFDTLEREGKSSGYEDYEFPDATQIFGPEIGSIIEQDKENVEFNDLGLPVEGENENEADKPTATAKPEPVKAQEIKSNSLGSYIFGDSGKPKDREAKIRLMELLRDKRVLDHINNLEDVTVSDGRVIWGPRFPMKPNNLLFTDFVNELEAMRNRGQFGPNFAPSNPIAPQTSIIPTATPETGSLLEAKRKGPEAESEFMANQYGSLGGVTPAEPTDFSRLLDEDGGQSVDNLRQFLEEDNIEQLILEARNTPEGQAMLEDLAKTDYGKRIIDRVMGGAQSPLNAVE